MTSAQIVSASIIEHHSAAIHAVSHFPFMERVVVSLQDDGSVDVVVGTQSTGQGHETTFAQVTADQIDVPFRDVSIRFGDSVLGVPLVRNGSGKWIPNTIPQQAAKCWRARRDSNS